MWIPIYRQAVPEADKSRRKQQYILALGDGSTINQSQFITERHGQSIPNQGIKERFAGP